MQYVDLLFGLVALVAMFGAQVAIIKRLTAFVKEMLNLKGNAARLTSFGVGLASGALFLWPWIEMNPGYSVSVYVVTGVLFLVIAGLTASGDYDLTNES